MVDALSEHFRLVQEREALSRMMRAVGYLEDLGIQYVVEGGWAVSSFGSSVESVDLDLIVPASQITDLHEGLVEVAGIQLDTEGGQELLGIDYRCGEDPNHLLGKTLHYVPFELLDGRVGPRLLQVGEGVQVPVPEADVLMLMKAKAFHDRRILWGASRDPVLFAALDVDDQRWARQFDTLHWERKAGKDLFDISFLGTRGASSDPWVGWVGDEFVSVVLESLREVPLPLRTFAQDMARRYRLKDLKIPPKL